MLKTAAARVLLHLGAHYDARRLYFQADRAERLARMVLSAAHENLDDGTFDYLWGLSDEKPHYEWQTPGPDEQPTATTPVVTRQQMMGLHAAGGDPAKSAPYQQNATWGEHTTPALPLPEAGRYHVPTDPSGKPSTGLKTKDGAGEFDGGFMSVEDIRRMIEESQRSGGGYAPERRRPHQFGVPAMAGA